MQVEIDETTQKLIEYYKAIQLELEGRSDEEIFRRSRIINGKLAHAIAHDHEVQVCQNSKLKLRPDILIRSGSYFDFLDPLNSDYTIEDIAHGLSNTCRFAGQTSSFYSVAQHSVMVSCLVAPEFKLDALMHDAAEAFLGDVASPLKQLLPEYKVIEERVEHAIRQRYSLSPALDASIKHADRVLLATEQRDLMPDHDDDWALIADIAPLANTIVPVTPTQAFEMFMGRFYQLVDGDN